MALPPALTNILALSLTDLILGVLSFIFQIVSLSELDWFDRVGTGIWGGFILVAAGLSAFFLHRKGGSGWLVGFAVVTAGMSFLVGFILLGVEANNIHFLDGLDCSFSSVCQTLMAMSALLMILGIFAIFANALLCYALIKAFLSSLAVSPVS